MSKFGLVFVFLLLAAALNAFARPAPADRKQHPAPNERLTALTGALLFICLFAIAASVLYLPRLLPVHYLVGFLAVPPIAVKLATTGYRFARYYTHDPSYRQAGAPSPLLRFVVAPLLVVSTVAVFATGIELWLFDVRFGSWWINAHTVSAVVFMIAAVIHLLSHLRRSARAVMETAPQARSIVVGSLVAGVVLAAASLTYATPFGSGAGGG